MAASAASTCSAAVYKMAAFMRQPAPADNINELLSPVWWVMDGKSISSYPFNTFWPQLAAYARNNGKAPVAGTAFLSSLIMLSLLILLLWRFVRGIRVICCQQEAYADASKVLFSKRLRIMRGLTVALGIAACATSVWGMVSLNKNVIPALNARIDSMQELPVKVVQQVTSLATDTAALSQPLNNITSIIDSIDVAGIRKDLERVSAFLKEAPSPTALKATLQQLSTALKPQLYEGLRQLHTQVNVASENSPLSTLRGYLDTLAAFDISVMGPAIRSYSDSLAALFDIITSKRSDAEVQASAQFAKLRSSYEQVDLDAWVPYIDQAVTTANAINAMRTPATNPFTITLKTLTGVVGTIEKIRGGMLTDLSTSVEHFNGLWHNNASVAFQSLLERAAHVNHTVLELPRDVESKIRMVNASVTDFMKLYTGGDSISTLPKKIQDAGAKLEMPNAASLIADLKAAEAQLNDAQGLPELTAKLATIARALDKTLRDAKSNIQPSLDAFAKDSSMRLDLQDTLTFEGPVVQGAASVFESINLGGFKDYVKAVRAKIDATIEPARREADAIPGTLKQISEFDVIGKFITPLQQAEQVYKQFGGNPANLTKPVLELLDRVSTLGSTDLANAKVMAANMSTAVKKMSDAIQSAAVEQIDKIQANYLGGSGSAAEATGRLSKAVHIINNAMLGAYGLVMGLTLVLMLMTLIKCAAGICITGFALNVTLVAFSLIPLITTGGLVLMRDTCGNMDSIAAKAVTLKTGNSTLGPVVSEYYLHGTASSPSTGLGDIIKGINAEYDVEGIKKSVKGTMDGLLKQVDDFTLRPQVNKVVTDTTARIEDLLGRMDSVLLTLGADSVSAVVQQGKSFFCCSLTNQVYIQWAATITVAVLAWLALQFALAVLSRLDTLSESCCAFKPYRSKDYGRKPGAPAAGMRTLGKRMDLPKDRPLQTVDSNTSDTVAVVSLGGGLLQTGASGKSSQSTKTVFHSTHSTAELPDCTPLPTPLALRTAPPQQALIASPRCAPAPAQLDKAAEIQRKQQQLLTGNSNSSSNNNSSSSNNSSSNSSSNTAVQGEQQAAASQQQASQQRRPRVGETRPSINITAVYPTVAPAAGMPGSPSAQQRQQQQQQAWATTPGGMPGKGLVRAPCTRI